MRSAFVGVVRVFVYMSNEDVSIDQMLGNMADPEEQAAKKVECPIDGCSYDGEPKTVSGHVSGSTLDDHVWANTRFDGWKHFNREMKEQVQEQLAEVRGDSSSESTSAEEARNEMAVENTSDRVLEEDGLPCPLNSCSIEGTAKDIVEHMSSSADHSWDETRFMNANEFLEFVEQFC